MDVVVTVPRSFGLYTWIAEGDPAGEEWSGVEWHFYLWGSPPVIVPGERVYIIYNGALRGYAPLVCIDRFPSGRYGLVRHGGAVAVSIPEFIQGFRGFRYRWWGYDQEQPFPDWQNPDAALFERARHEETSLRARNIPSRPPRDLEHAYELTQAIEQAAAKQSPERPVFGDPAWIERTKPKAAPSHCIIEVNGKRI